jgi:carboxyl-terminal processing protease
MNTRSRWLRCAAAVVPLALGACGGDDEFDDAYSQPASCSVADQNAWLASYFDDWYFWYRLSPRPNAAGYTSVDAYFQALLYTGSSPTFPADRWSFTESDSSFNLFFDAGQQVGYGVFVAGLETEQDPSAPLYVRYVEAQSPAAALGVKRGDRIMSVNGQSASTLIAADDYSAFSATATGQALTLVLRDTTGDRTVTVTSAQYALTPVNTALVVTSPQGRKMGYVVVKDMLHQAEPGFESAFAQFKSAGVTEVVLDLRYNGGGFVSVGAELASYVAGSRGNGHAYASLLYNDKRAADYNTRYGFVAGLVSAAGVARVFVLTGQRTCSASEQVVNGLRGIGVDVVTVGDTTCGKPVGFLPISACGTTFSAVNFEAVNERNEGRYFDGFAATCPVAEDFTQPLGATAEPLLASAQGYADSGVCPLPQQTPLKSRAREGGRRSVVEGNERQGMLGR